MIARAVRVPLLLAWLAWQAIVSTAHIAWAALTPGPMAEPALVRYPMRSRTDLEVTALAWAITVTPGTLTVAIGRTDMWVHVVFGAEREELIAQLADVERRLLAILRPDPDEEPS